MRIQLLVALMVSPPSSVAQTQVADPLMPVALTASAPNLDYKSYPKQVPGGIVYAHYAKDGHHYDFTLLEAESGKATEFVVNAVSPVFLALSDDYFAYSDGQKVAQRIFLVDRNTNRKTQSIRLQDYPYAAFIDGDRLLVFQAKNALVFSLPKLTLTKSVPIPTVTLTVSRWGANFIILGGDLTVLGDDLKVQRVIPLARHAAKGNGGCTPSSVTVNGQQALVTSGCGLVDVVDLATGEHVSTIDIGAGARPTAAIENFLFVADDPESSYHRIRAFDLTTGRFLAQRPGVASLLVGGHTRLMSLAGEAVRSRSAAVTIYAPNLVAIASDADSLTRITTACHAPAGRSRGLYEAIDDCEAAGIQRFLGRANVPAEARTALEQYAEWLSHSLSRFPDALPVLGQLQESPRVKPLRARVDRKQLFLGPPTEQPDTRPQPLGVRNLPLPPYTDHMMVFVDKYMFVSREDCDGSPPFGVGIDIHDRATLELVSSVPVVDCDDNFQDEIGSIQKVGEHLLVELDFKYEDESRANIAVIDLKRSKSMGTLHLDQGIEALSVWKDMVLRCSEGEPATLMNLDSLSFAPASPDARAACQNGGARKLANSEHAAVPPLSYLTTHYEVTQKSLPDGETKLFLARPGATPSPLNLALPRDSQLTPVPDLDTVVVTYNAEGERVVSIIDLATRSLETLCRLRDSFEWGPGSVWRHFLFVPRGGRDLLTYDLEKRVVVDYERNLIRDGMQPACVECNGGDKVASLFIDRDQMIVTTLYGLHSRAINLPRFVERFRGVDFFEPAP